MKNPEAAAFVRDIMRRLGAKNPTELSRALGGQWTTRDQQRKLYKWHDGEAHPNGPASIALIRAAGLLNEEGEAAVPSVVVDPLAHHLAALEAKVDALPTAEDLQRGLESLRRSISRASRGTGAVQRDAR